MNAFKEFFTECEYSSISFDRVLNHTWERHSISQGFEYKCDISNCTRKYANIQSFRRHLKSHHSWFYDNFVRCYAGENHNRQVEVDEVGLIDENILTEPPDQDEESMSEEPGDPEDHLTNSISDFDDLVSGFLLELREKYSTTTEATCFVSEQVSKILVLDGKIRNSMLKSSLNRNGNFPLGYEPDMIMSCKSPFAQAFDKFAGKKKLDQYIMTQNFYVKPQEISIGFDSVKNKGDSIQYVPIFETLNVILQQEDVLGELTSNCESEHANLETFKSFKDGRYFKKNVLFQSNPNALQICLYHDDFNTRYLHFILS